MAFYLKYRSQKIADLDLTSVREGLTKLVNSGRVPHALLFSGPRGSGKTSAARILAKAVNCLENGGKGEPCNHCEVCRQITSQTLVDLLEIDGASNRGIDDIRDLKEKIKLTPLRARCKVYIIDEVHMLTTEAFNALLKTLEEPPEHAFFILCTTEPEKLPQTILSRCLRFNFQKGTPTEIKRSLERVVKGEKLKVEKGVLDLIAKKVDGSFRDGQKLLDQLSLTGKEISLQETKELLGEIELFNPRQLLDSLYKNDLKEGLTIISHLSQTGADLKLYLINLLQFLRLLLMQKLEVEKGEESVSFSDWTIQDLKKLLALFSQAASELKNAVISQLPLELAVIEWCEIKVNNEKFPPKADHPLDEKVQSQKNPNGDSDKLGSVEDKVSLGKDSALKVVSPIQSKESNGNGQLKLEKVKQCWTQILTQVKPLNHSIEALLRSCHPSGIEDDFLFLDVYYQFHKERLEDEKIRQIIEEVAGQVLGTPVKLKCRLGQKPKINPLPSSLPDSENQADGDILKVAENIFSGKAVE